MTVVVHRQRTGEGRGPRYGRSFELLAINGACVSELAASRVRRSSADMRVSARIGKRRNWNHPGAGRPGPSGRQLGAEQPCQRPSRIWLILMRADTMAAFAREHGLRPGTFASWVRDVSPPPPKPSEPPAFLAVVTTAGGARAEAFSVHVGEVALRFAGPPSPAWFAAVLRELAPC